MGSTNTTIPCYRNHDFIAKLWHQHVPNAAYWVKSRQEIADDCVASPVGCDRSAVPKGRTHWKARLIPDTCGDLGALWPMVTSQGQLTSAITPVTVSTDTAVDKRIAVDTRCGATW
jgi:hypothetical protein